jgi:hypothetical protein
MVFTEIDRAVLMLSAVARSFGRKYKVTSALINNTKANRYIVYLIIEMSGKTLAHSPGSSTSKRSAMVKKPATKYLNNTSDISPVSGFTRFDFGVYSASSILLT